MAITALNNTWANLKKRSSNLDYKYSQSICIENRWMRYTINNNTYFFVMDVCIAIMHQICNSSAKKDHLSLPWKRFIEMDIISMESDASWALTYGNSATWQGFTSKLIILFINDYYKYQFQNFNWCWIRSNATVAFTFHVRASLPEAFYMYYNVIQYHHQKFNFNCASYNLKFFKKE